MDNFTNEINRTAELFKQGFSCTQAVFAGFGERYHIDREIALKLGRGFGAGMGLGLTCGAVIGAGLVLGFAGGGVEENDRRARYGCYDAIRDFVSRFEARYGTIRCNDLLGVDMSTEVGRKEAQEKNLFAGVCSEIVQNSSRILAELIQP
ncbi:MAG: C_GCAxxG_C_C family protein [Deltaproteobacteria bacterium]|nr:C_GCAxxG_C_C family protein [Deltaproteobacteria bacterium]MBF0524258.1 C_GCAxxG_C_C family protein [Deltaproteobacteria bacterium]